MNSYKVGTDILYNVALGMLDIEKFKNDKEYQIELYDCLREMDSPFDVDELNIKARVLINTGKIAVAWVLGQYYETIDYCVPYEEIVKLFAEIPMPELATQRKYLCLDLETEQAVDIDTCIMILQEEEQ